MRVDQKYSDILQKLQQGERALYIPGPELLGDIQNELKRMGEKYQKDDHLQLKKILCLLSHTQRPVPTVANSLLSIALQLEQKEFELQIFMLRCLLKHVIEHCQLQGRKYPAQTYDMLRKFLKVPSAEVLEWALRTIDQIGMKSIALKNEIRSVRPGVFSLLNPHHRNSRAIIAMLEKRWII